MRYKEFFIRTGFLIPVVTFAVFVFMIALGIISNVCGAGEEFYCSVFCKTGLSLLITVLAIVIYYQAKVCWKN